MIHRVQRCFVLAYELRARFEMPFRIHVQRSRFRGVTLMEVLVVVAIMSLIAAGVGIAAYEYWNETRVRTAMTDARTLRGAVKSWWVLTGNDGCPTVAELVRARVLDAD